MTKDQIDEAAAKVAPDDSEQSARLIKAFEQWEQARAYAKKEAERVNGQLAARIAQFAEAMNIGHSDVNDQILKLSVVESRWQELEDARDEKKQVAEACRDAIKAAEQKIKDLIQQSKQLDLFQQSAEDAPAAESDSDAA